MKVFATSYINAKQSTYTQMLILRVRFFICIQKIPMWFGSISYRIVSFAEASKVIVTSYGNFIQSTHSYKEWQNTSYFIRSKLFYVISHLNGSNCDWLILCQALVHYRVEFPFLNRIYIITTFMLANLVWGMECGSLWHANKSDVFVFQ